MSERGVKSMGRTGPVTAEAVVDAALAVIGGGMLVATAAWVRKSARAPWISLMMGAVVMLWIVVQVAIIGWTSPLQPISFVAGAAVAALAGIILRRERRAQVAPVA